MEKRAYRAKRASFLIVGAALLGAGFAACGGAATTATTAGTGASSTVSTSSNGGTTSSAPAASSSSGIVLTTTSSSGAGGGDGGCVMGGSCTSNAQCDNGNGTCIISGGEVQVGVCVYSTCDAGVNCSVDTTCSVADAGTIYPPFVALYPPDVPANCHNGFELCNADGAPTYTIKAKTAAGSRALTLDLDFATYLEPDGVLITGIDGCGNPYVLFDSCRLQTADQAQGAYTNGMMRPTDPAIRQFHLTLREGTSQLTFDFSNVQSPMYLQVLGLCDFTITTVPSVGWFSLVP